ncbi:hypothetical protein QNM99_10605 [Pseudomonas sp. PCH446]
MPCNEPVDLFSTGPGLLVYREEFYPMHVNEIDFRSTPLLTLCTTATNAIAELIDFSKAGLFDGTTSLEYAEYFNGAVLVACQAYVVGTVADINKMRVELGKSRLKKLDLYRQNSRVINGYTQVEFINALANFFKHNEEWESWPSNETTKALQAFGIVESTAFHLHVGIQNILGIQPIFAAL